MPHIHPTAIIEDGAHVHSTASIGAHTIIESGAVVGPECVIGSQVRIYAHTRLGQGNRIDHGAVIGCEPQHLGYDPTRARPLTIGDHNHIREGVNISHGLEQEQGTVIGHHNYLMFGCHIGHDCVVGDHNIFANNATLAGNVVLEHHIFLSGHVAVHQFCRIGAYAMISGISGVNLDIPPYVTADGHRATIVGLNSVGLRRGGFSVRQRSTIKRAYRLIYKSGLQRNEALTRLNTEYDDPAIKHILIFFKGSHRGIAAHR